MSQGGGTASRPVGSRVSSRVGRSTVVVVCCSWCTMVIEIPLLLELLEVSWFSLGVGRAGAFVFSGRFCGSGCGAGGGDLAAQRFELRWVPGGAVEDSVPSGLAPQLGVDACGGGVVGPYDERIVGDAGFDGESVTVGLDLEIGRAHV